MTEDNDLPEVSAGEGGIGSYDIATLHHEATEREIKKLFGGFMDGGE
jgi:hypothetical protein